MERLLEELEMNTNPVGIAGISFVEFASSTPEKLEKLFLEFGFSKVMRHEKKAVDLFVQEQMVFLLNYEKGSFGDSFQKCHGPSICSMGWKTTLTPDWAKSHALQRGARSASTSDFSAPAIFGIGDSLIYFTSAEKNRSGLVF
jgi:4-hydroxyphenylpyruvate dioxygenase